MSYRILQPIPSEYPYIWREKKFILFFISVSSGKAATLADLEGPRKGIQNNYKSVRSSFILESSVFPRENVYFYIYQIDCTGR